MILSGGTTTLGVYDFKAGLDKEASSVNSANGETQQQVNDYIGTTWYAKVGGYNVNYKVRLATGDVVISTVVGNTVDPNSDMTGWAYATDVLNVDSVSELRSKRGKTKQLAQTFSYLSGSFKGASKYFWDESSTAADNGWSVIAVAGVATGRWVMVDPYQVNSYQIGIDDTANNNETILNSINLSNIELGIVGDVDVSDSVNLNASYFTVKGVGANSSITYQGDGGSANTLAGRKPVLKLFNDGGAAVAQSSLSNLTVQMNYKPFTTGIDARYFTAQSKMRDIIIRGVADNSVGMLINKSWYAVYDNFFISGYNHSIAGRHGTGVILESTLGDGGQLNALSLGISCHSLNTGYLINPTNYIYALGIGNGGITPTIENCDIGIKVNTTANDYQVRQSVVTAYFENNGIDIQWGDPSTSVAKNSKHTWIAASADDVLSRVELYQGHHTFIGWKGIKTLVVGQYAQVEFINTPRPTTLTDPYNNSYIRQDPSSQITAGSYQTVSTKPQGMLKLKGTISSGSTVTFDIASALNTSIASEGQTGELRITSRRSYDTSLLIYKAILLRKSGGLSYLMPNSDNSAGLTVSISGTVITVTDARGDTRFIDLTFRPD